MVDKDFLRSLNQRTLAIQRKQRRESAASSKNKGGGKGGFWGKRLVFENPEKDGNRVIPAPTELIRLVPYLYKVPPHVVETDPTYAEDMELFHYIHIDYWHNNRRKYAIDTRDWADGNDISLHLMEMGEEIRPRKCFYHNALHLGFWHEVYTSKTVQDRDTGKSKDIEVKDWERCLGKTCPICDELGKEHRQLGRPGFIQLSPALQDSLDAIENEVAQFCVCGCTTPLQVASAQCSACSFAFAEAEAEYDGVEEELITLEDIASIYATYSTCPECNTPLSEDGDGEEVAYVHEELACANDRCPDTTRATLYHADLALRKVGFEAKVRLELDRSRFSSKGFQIRDLPDEQREKIEIFDFPKELKMDIAKVAEKLGVKASELPFDLSGGEGGYTARRTPKRPRYSR